MFDTDITVVGTVLTQPEPRHTTTTNALVVTFRVVSNARRFDKENNVWVDKSHLRLKVNCWRRLGESVLASVNVGDPVILKGRLQTQDWKTEEGEARMSYEVDAVAVGHDLSRGRGTFTRVRGENALVVDDDERGGPKSATGGGDEEDAATDMDAVAILRSAGLVPSFGGGSGSAGFTGGGIGGGSEADDEDGDQDEDESSGADAGSGGSGGRSRRRGRMPVPA
jgi:single-strand DNA-binding protein